MNHLVDLHAHSSASDGKLKPAEVVAYAASRGVDVLALTDHDTLDGIEPALEAAHLHGLTLLSGVEITSELGSKEAHLLGYFIDQHNQRLRDRLQLQRERREQRLEETLRLLAVAGCSLSLAQVQEIAGEASIGRPHIARALVQAGYASDISDAFARFLSEGRLAYIPAPVVEIAEAIELVRDAGGLPVLAHPLKLREYVPGLLRLGLVGLEVYYAVYSDDEIKALAVLARELGLLQTGGSDFHGLGNPEGRDIGSAPLPWEHVIKLLEWNEA